MLRASRHAKAGRGSGHSGPMSLRALGGRKSAGGLRRAGRGWGGRAGLPGTLTVRGFTSPRINAFHSAKPANLAGHIERPLVQREIGGAGLVDDALRLLDHAGNRAAAETPTRSMMVMFFNR